jgi:hypothetical protein
MWTKSACVLLAWSIALIVAAAGVVEPARPAQANTRNANSTQAIIVTRTPAATGMPAWLTAMLLAVGIVIGGAFLLRLAMADGRRQRKAAVRAAQVYAASALREPPSASPAGDGARIVLADHDRLIVTHSRADDTVYVLRPSGEDPRAILRVARLVLAEGRYRQLAEHLGLPASWPNE